MLIHMVRFFVLFMIMRSHRHTRSHSLTRSYRLIGLSINNDNINFILTGMTPLLAASVTGHVPIVEHLIKLPCVSRADRIAALELLGVTFVDKRRDMLGALAYWRRAMEDR